MCKNRRLQNEKKQKICERCGRYFPLSELTVYAKGLPHEHYKCEACRKGFNDKFCMGCGKYINISEFPVDYRYYDGLALICKDCFNREIEVTGYCLDVEEIEIIKSMNQNRGCRTDMGKRILSVIKNFSLQKIICETN